jgi:hypothetical protein
VAAHEFVIRRITPSDPLSAYRWTGRVLQSVMLSAQRVQLGGFRPQEPPAVPRALAVAGAVSAVIGIGGALLAMTLDTPGLHGIAGLGLVGLTLAGIAYRRFELRSGR